MKSVKAFILSILIASPSKIKAFYFRKVKNYVLGRKVTFGKKSWIYGEDIIIGDFVKIGDNTTINGRSIRIEKNTVISNNVKIFAAKSIQIGNNCFIDNDVTFGGGQTRHSELFVGNRVKVFEKSYINTTRKVVLEDEVGIGGRTLIFTHGSWQNAYKGYPYKFGDVIIKKHAWLPWQVFVMPGVTIGQNATIGSAAMVVKDVPDNCFAAGFPAKVIKQKEEYVKSDNGFQRNLLIEIFKEVCSDYNFLHQKKLVFDEDLMSVSENENVMVQFVDQDIKDLNSKTLYIYDSKKQLDLENYINLFNNKTRIRHKTHFSDFFVTFISNFGIRTIED